MNQSEQLIYNNVLNNKSCRKYLESFKTIRETWVENGLFHLRYIDCLGIDTTLKFKIGFQNYMTYQGKIINEN